MNIHRYPQVSPDKWGPNRAQKGTSMRAAMAEQVSVFTVGPFAHENDLFSWLRNRSLWPHRIYRIGREWHALVRIEES